ncbi:MAG TPA: DUF4124 domain-containing protein [Dyella sp.]|uniref:DUF4124 domain-containing protein n=1 Tax=Dyella sp. TaxID=1869338 RepID=UPI002D794274|nr:DUF4124 domain-containing protein [Dyella sp.]HET6553929.1 DUF4124 domain-containing protein [Dyella sp.]
MIRLGILLLLLLPLRLMAQDGIHRCVGPDGNPLFTDQPCAALQATPAVAPREPAAPAAAPLANASPPPMLCAATVAELRQSVVDAFASRDPNRLAGLMLWNGYGRDAVVADIRLLGGLMQHPLLDVGPATEDAPSSHGEDAAPADSSQEPTGSPNTDDRGLVVRTAASDGSGSSRETRFDVVRRSGCLWLRGRG